MKANLTLLEESVGTFSETIKAQRNFVLKILGNITQQNQSYPTNRFWGIQNEKLLSSLKTHSEDAKSLLHKVKQIKEVLPKVKSHDINEIQAYYRELRSVFSIC